MPYELIDHTGDVGLAVRGVTLEDLFAEAARGMFEILVDNPHPFPAGFETFALGQGAAPGEELRDFLGELLYRFSADRRLYGPFAPEPGRVRAGVETFDPARHVLRTELKAVTYHQLEAVRDAAGWTARVIFDV